MADDTHSVPGSVFVTGAGGGIGSAVVELLAKLGTPVIAFDNRPTGTDGRVGLTLEIRGDVTDERSVIEAMDRGEQQLGPLWGLVCCAGVLNEAPIDEVSVDQWRTTLDVNVVGTFVCVREALRRLGRRGGGGSIVTVASALAVRGAPTLVDYAASKAAVASMTRSAATVAAASGVRVNSVAPGAINTAMLRGRGRTAVKRLSDAMLSGLGEPHQVAEVILFLLSSASDYINGQMIQVDGGGPAVA